MLPAETFLFVVIPESLRMLPDALWRRALTSLFFTFVFLFTTLPTVSKLPGAVHWMCQNSSLLRFVFAGRCLFLNAGQNSKNHE